LHQRRRGGARNHKRKPRRNNNGVSSGGVAGGFAVSAKDPAIFSDDLKDRSLFGSDVYSATEHSSNNNNNSDDGEYSPRYDNETHENSDALFVKVVYFNL
jgi:hypothetical protein